MYLALQDNSQWKLMPPLSLKWRTGKDMPIKMNTTVHSVVIEESVYVGGGNAASIHIKCTVMKFDLQRDEWTKLPQYSAMFFAMATINSQLALVGGQDPVTGKPTNQIALFASGKWISPYPPMYIARHSSTAVCFKNYIIVAGGWDNEGHGTSSVEVLDVAKRSWYIADSLPNTRSSVKSTLIGNVLYLMGGYDHTDSTKAIHMVNLSELISKAISKQATPTLWQDLEEAPLKYSAPLNVGGSLLAVGGRHCNDPSSTIHLYQPDIRQWVKVGDLPSARYCCTCSVLPSGEIIVAGGDNGQSNYLATVDFLTVS